MVNVNDVRRAHDLLDDLDARAELSQEQEKLLRSFLPERTKDATLDDLLARVHAAWISANPSDWGFDTPAEHHDWLFDLRNDLIRIIEEQDAPATVPALPDGMRIAVHAVYGRVVVSPVVDDDGTCKIFHLSTHTRDGSDYCWAPIDSLTFIDYEPAKPAPAHPEFLETEADYANAPEGTIVASSGRFPWVKGAAGEWACSSSNNSNFAMSKIGRRNVLRWGWGDK